jgi:polar amino acid transport system substrate-binding protein
MAEQLALDETRFSFAHAIDFLTMKGYLAANINTDQRYVDALKAAFNEVVMTPRYNAVMMLAQRP